MPYNSLHMMEPENATAYTEFLLLEFSEDSELHPFIFGLFLSKYLITA